MTDITESEVFEYERDRSFEEGKRVLRLTQTDSFRADVQLVGEDGANNLHSHTGNDGFWFVLNGEATFYGEDDAVIGQVGEHQGVLIPHGQPYWFESSGDHPLEILHIASYVEGVDDRRIDHYERHPERGPE